MKKTTILILLSLMIGTVAMSAPFKTGDRVIIAKDEQITGNLTVVGRTVIINGQINGDCLIFAERAEINGEIRGDILAVGRTVIIKSPLVSDVRALGASVRINSRISGELFLSGNTVKVEKGTEVGGETTVYATDILISGIFNSNARFHGDWVQINKGTIFQQNLLVSSGGRGLSIADSVFVAGTKEIGQNNSFIDGAINTLSSKFNIISLPLKIWSFISSFIVALAIILLMPNYVRLVNQTINTKPVLSIISGILAPVLLLLLAIILFISAVGIPLSILIFGILSLGLYSANLFVAIWLGAGLLALITKKEHPSFLFSLIIGFVIFWLITSIPYVGWVIRFIALILGFGALFVSRLNYFKHMRAQNIL